MTSEASPATPSEETAVIRQVWDAAAGSYDSLWGHGLKTDLEVKAWSALLARLFPPGQPITIIDVGCGTGVLCLLLAELGHQVIGFDLSEEMVRVCQATADARALTSLRLVAGQAGRPPAGIGPADAVISRHVLWTLPRPEAAVKAWVELTRPGGRVVSLDGLWSGQADFRHYPAEIDMCLPFRCVRSLDPAPNLWRRAGLVDVMAEEHLVMRVVGLEEEWLARGQDMELMAAAGLPEVDLRHCWAGREEAVPVIVGHAYVCAHDRHCAPTSFQLAQVRQDGRDQAS
jgi:SAM-dependent methyltransferase